MPAKDDSDKTGSTAETDGSPASVDSVVRRRRLWLYALASLALLAVLSVAVVQIFAADDDPVAQREQAASAAQPTIVERFKLTAARGQKGRGIAELVRLGSGEQSLRILAIDLKPSGADEVYQAVLSGGKSQPKLLGSVVVADPGTFIGRAKIDATQLHTFRRIELRRVAEDGSLDELVVRGAIPR